MKRLTRRDFLRVSGMSAAGVVAAACVRATPMVIEKEVIKEVAVEKAVIVEKEVPKEIVKEVRMETRPLGQTGESLPVETPRVLETLGVCWRERTDEEVTRGEDDCLPQPGVHRGHVR